MMHDSRVDTLQHSQRVGELMVQITHEILSRSTCHDRSKTLPPEVQVFDEFTPKLKNSTYGSDEYMGFLAAMGEGLKHHYAENRHHPEHFANGVNDMTLADLVEMLADWKAATERHDDGDLAKSLRIQQRRFNLSDQLTDILQNTAEHFGWMSPIDKIWVHQGGDETPHDLADVQGRLNTFAQAVVEQWDHDLYVATVEASQRDVTRLLGEVKRLRAATGTAELTAERDRIQREVDTYKEQFCAAGVHYRGSSLNLETGELEPSRCEQCDRAQRVAECSHDAGISMKRESLGWHWECAQCGYNFGVLGHNLPKDEAIKVIREAMAKGGSDV